MGNLSEFPLKYRMFLAAYPWRRIDPVPWSPLRKPLSRCRVGLVSSAGLTGPGQEPFDPTARGGDCSFREIPRGIDLRELIDSHRSDAYDHGGIHADRNLAFPLDRLEELERAGRIGEVAPRQLSFMGSITAPGRLTDRVAPQAAALLAGDDVDVALLVPV